MGNETLVAFDQIAPLADNHHPLYGALPIMFCGTTVPNGDASPWLECAVGSLYAYQGAGISMLYQKVKKNSTHGGRDDDWTPLSGSIRQRILFSDFTDGGATVGTKTLAAQIPAGAFVQQVILLDVTGFTGNTSAVITLGDGTDVDRYNTGTPSVFTTAVAIDVGVPSGTKVHVAAATVTVTVTTASDFTSVSAGAMTVCIHFLM